MSSALLLPFGLLLLSLALIWQLFRSLSRLRVCYKHGCLPAVRLPQSPWCLGSDIQAQMAVIKSSGHVTRSLQSLFEQHGCTFQATIWGQPWLFTCDVQNIKAINTTCFTNFGVEPLRKVTNTGWMGDGIFVSDGDHWRMSRSLFKPLFARTGEVHLNALQRQINILFDVLPANGETVDLQTVFRRMYLDISFEYLLGASPGALSSDGTSNFDVDRFHAAFETATVGMSRRHSLGRAFRWADQGEEQWRRACSYVHKIFDVHVDAAIRKHEAQANEDDGLDNNQPVEKHHSPISMLHSLVQLTHDRVFLRDQLLNVFLGAKDTATIGISDIFFHLARHPDVWRKLRAEVMASTVPGQSLTFNDVKALHYLQNVLKESLRLLSPVDLMSRVCTKDTILPRGGGSNGDASLFVSKGTRIEGRLAPMHQDKKYWGDDAENFVPERWEQWEGKTGAGKLKDAKVDVVVAELVEDEVLTSESKFKYSRPPRWEYIPFLGGGRMCPARQMTLTQYALLLVHFAQRFARIENRDNEIEFIEQIKFGKQSANGVLVGLIRDK